MGGDRFDRQTYASYTSTKASLKGKSDYTKMDMHETFENSSMPQALDPKKITVRESCDSEVNPNSLPIILALDLTGSMGHYAHKIATVQLPDVMGGIVEQRAVADPHLMFMGVTDVHAQPHRAPLQVSQFEASAEKINDQLTQLWQAGGGGGNDYESYDLPWYFATHKTKIDSYDKRNVKGFLFTFGDELPPQSPLREKDLKYVFGDKGQYVVYDNTKSLLAAAQEKWRVFHVVVEEGSYANSNKTKTREKWTELLGPNAIFMRNHEYLPQIVIATLQIAEGEDINTVLNYADDNIREELKYAFCNALKATQ